MREPDTKPACDIVEGDIGLESVWQAVIAHWKAAASRPRLKPCTKMLAVRRTRAAHLMSWDYGEAMMGRTTLTAPRYVVQSGIST